MRRVDCSRAGVLAIGCAVALLLLSLPASSSARTIKLRGIVVHRSHKARAFVLADRAGNLVEVHSTQVPRLGRRVKVVAQHLRAAFTYVASQVTVLGAAGRTDITGVVTYIAPRRGLFALSSGGGTILIHHDKHQGKVPNLDQSVTVRVHVSAKGVVTERHLARGKLRRGTAIFHGVLLSFSKSTKITLEKRIAGSCDRCASTTQTYTIDTPTMTLTSEMEGALGSQITVPVDPSLAASLAQSAQEQQQLQQQQVQIATYVAPCGSNYSGGVPACQQLPAGDPLQCLLSQQLSTSGNPCNYFGQATPPSLSSVQDALQPNFVLASNPAVSIALEQALTSNSPPPTQNQLCLYSSAFSTMSLCNSGAGEPSF